MTTKQISREQYLKEVQDFRRRMLDGRNSIEQIDEAFGCLFTITNHAVCDEFTDGWWEATVAEWVRRKELMLLHGHPLTHTKER